MTSLGKSISALFATTLTSVAMAGSITPTSFEATIDENETTVVQRTVTTDATGIGIVDFFFLADNTGSMGGVIDNVRNAATQLTGELSTTFSSPAFGVGRYFGDPSESGESFTSAYEVLQPISTTAADSVSAIGDWTAGFGTGGDIPEANLYALQQAATNGADTAGPGTGSGEETGWRAGAQKVVLWFGDVPGHQDVVSLSDTISTLLAEDVIVVGFNSTSAGTGLDQDFADGRDPGNQATEITEATGGTLINDFSSVSGDGLIAAVTGAIGVSTSILDLALEVVGGVPDGLDLSFVCTDVRGCSGVGGGESRTFDMTVTGLISGTYDFAIRAPGVDATGLNRIVVGAVVPPPLPPAGVSEPSSFALFGLGLLGLGLRARRQR